MELQATTNKAASPIHITCLPQKIEIINKTIHLKADTSRMFRSKWQKQFQWKKVAMYVEAKTSHQKSWP